MTKSTPLLIITIGVVIIALGLYGYTLLPQVKPVGINQVNNASGEVSLSLTPSSINSTIGNESTLTLAASAPSVKLVVLTVELSYDPAKIGMPMISVGDWLPNTLASPKIENGKITFTVAATPESGGVTGTGTVVTIKFKPTATGTTIFAFSANSSATAINASGERIPTNTLKTASDATVVIGSTTQSTTTPSPSPSVTPAPTKNTISVISTTPKPTVKPKVTATPSVTPTVSPRNDSSDLSDETSIDQPNLDTTTSITPQPPFFQRVFLGWKIIFQYILKLFVG